MEQKQKANPPVKTIAGVLIGYIPFLLVILVFSGSFLLLKQKISARQTDVIEQQRQVAGVERPPTNVVSMEMIPGEIIEKISLPGIARPWVSLQVVAEIKGKIVSKKIREGDVVEASDVLAVIDESDYQNLYDSALASYESALTMEKRLAALTKKQFVTQSQLDDAVARVKTTRAALDNAKLNLSRCIIRAPMKGVVDKVFVENGQFMGAGDPVATILQLDRVKVVVGIPESDVDAVRKLKTFDMTVDALGKKSFQGKQYYLSKTTGDLARLYDLQIAVDNPGHQILPGMFARVTIVKNRVENGLAVPMYSLLSRDGRTGVYIEKDSIARFREVETGIQEGWRIQIPSGLEPGERVVVMGHRIIEDGERINVSRVVKDMEELSL